MDRRGAPDHADEAAGKELSTMSKLVTTAAWAVLLVGCGSNMPEPKQAMSDAESATRSAREVGADTQPEAKLQVKLADEQIALAKRFVSAGNFERATYLLLRARADAELALALAHEQNALIDKKKAVELSSTTMSDNDRGTP